MNGSRMKRRFLFFFLYLGIALFAGCASLPAQIASSETTLLSDSGEVPPDLAVFQPNLVTSFRDELKEFSTATRYRIELTIGEDISSVQGHQHVRYTNNEDFPLEGIYFRLFPNVSSDYLKMESVALNGKPVEFSMEFDNTAVKVVIPEKIDPGQSVSFEMDFSQQVPSVMSGNYGLYVYLDDILALDAFFPIIPVYDDEGWNVEDPPPNADMIFTDASFFEVTVSAPEDLVIVSSGVESASQTENGRQIRTFVGGPQRDFYLAASPRFVSDSTQVNKTLVTSYYPQEYQAMGELVLDTAAKALRIYSERYGEYPYTELDLVSTPMQAGGMEYSGAAALALNFYQPGSPINDVPRDAFLESATAHEVAHQWFFNQVMNDQLDEPWLDEGFAQYLTYIYYLDAYGESAADSYLESWSGRWARVDYAEIPIGKPAGEYAGSEYSPIIYGRAPIFIRELEKVMGEDTFSVFLRDYIDDYRWKNVDTLQFKRKAEEACGCDLSPLFNDWWATE